ncbi:MULTISPECIES: aminotransferase class V-fold PLP-dependent enzyme [unclassified Nitrospina]|uniref:aminotransferase class V-fold PLP-dependent enzyme n=1 Tax=unclassified Nitrospina TaxID=2638683 RepID=UPI003F9B049E
MDWDQWRDEFPVTQNRIFLDHAKVAPLPKRVQDRVAAFLKDASENGTAYYPQWMVETDRVRARFAELINADEDEVAFVKNTSEGISIVANGIDWKEGDNVVIPNIEFPANVYPWMNLKRLGVEVRWVKSVRGRVPFEQIAAQVNNRTRVVSVSSVECNSGFRNDLNQIGAFCKEKGIYFCVDAIQSLGVLPMDVKRDHIDFLAADGHKWLLSVEGLGGFYISKRVLENVYPAVVGWDSVVNANDYLNYDFTFRPGARRFEEGSFNVMSIFAFGAALDVLLEVGIDNVEQRVKGLGDVIMERVKQRGGKIVNSTEPGERSGIVSFTLNCDLEKLKTFLAGTNVSLTIRDGLIRLSPHFYNNETDIDRCFEHIDQFLKK